MAKTNTRLTIRQLIRVCHTTSADTIIEICNEVVV